MSSPSEARPSSLWHLCSLQGPPSRSMSCSSKWRLISWRPKKCSRFAFAFCLLAVDALSFTGYRTKDLQPEEESSRVRKRAPNTIRLGLQVSCAILPVVCVVVSSQAVAETARNQLSPDAIPAYDSAAYHWLSVQRGDGRMLLVPPSYSVTYPFNSG